MTEEHRKLLLILFVAIVLFALFSSSALLQTAFNSLTNELSAFSARHGALGPLIFCTLAAMSVLLGPFSSVPLVPPAVAVWGTGTTLGLLLAGWLAGGIVAYLIGEKFGYPIARRLIGMKKLDQWLSELTPQLTFPILLLFRIATPSETGYIFGLLKYRFDYYLIITVITELPFGILMVSGSHAFNQTGWLSFLAIAAAWVLLVVFSIRLFNRKTRRRNSERLS